MKAKDKYAANGITAGRQRLAAQSRDLADLQSRNNALRADALRRKQEVLDRVTARLSKNPPELVPDVSAWVHDCTALQRKAVERALKQLVAYQNTRDAFSIRFAQAS